MWIERCRGGRPGGDLRDHRGLSGPDRYRRRDAAKAVGALIAKRAAEAKVDHVVFDRGGYLFHGRIKALADAAREAGMKF